MTATFRLSHRQIFVLVLLTSICVTPFGFPSLHVHLERHIWIASLSQLAVTLVGSLGVLNLLRRFPDQPLLEIAQAALGRFGGRVYVLLVAVFLYLWGPIGNETTLLRMIQATELTWTNTYLIIGAGAVMAVYAAYFGPEVIARVAEVWSFLVIPVLVVLAVFPYSEGDPGLLLPLGGVLERLPFKSDFGGFSLGLRGFIVVLALSGMFNVQRASRAVLGASVAAAFFVSLLVMLPHTTFGPQTMQRLQFPVLESLDAVNAAAIGVQSFASVTMIVWDIIGWAVVSTTLFAGAHLFGAALGIDSYRWLLPPLAITSIVVVGVPHTPDTEQFVINVWAALGYAVGVAGPWILVSLTSLRAAGGRRLNR